MMKKGKELGGPEAERAMAHINMSVEEWEKMTEEEKAAKIAQLPPLGSGRADKGFEGEYILEDSEGHTHSVKLDKEGNGTSSTQGDHSHDIKTNECQESAGHKHSIAANASKDGEEEPAAENESEAEKPPASTSDLDVTAHEKLLKEKVDAIAAMSKKLADEAGVMAPTEIQALISDIERIGWDLRDMTSVIQAKKLTVDGAIMDSAKENMNLGAKLKADNKTMLDEHASLVDEVMDHTPPYDRKHYEEKSTDELKELVLTFDMVDSKESASHSNDGQAMSVSDAYEKAVKKRLNR